MQSALLKITTPKLLSGLVITMLLLDCKDLIVLRHSLCIKKSPTTIGVPQ